MTFNSMDGQSASAIAGDLMREEFKFINNYLTAINSYLAFLPQIRTLHLSSFYLTLMFDGSR